MYRCSQNTFLLCAQQFIVQLAAKMSDMQMPIGNQITMINSEVACPVQCLCIAQLGVKEYSQRKDTQNAFILFDNNLLLT